MYPSEKLNRTASYLGARGVAEIIGDLNFQRAIQFIIKRNYSIRVN